MYKKEEIIEALDKTYEDFINHVLTQEDHFFIKGPINKWTSGQHVDHLIRSIKPVKIILKLPKFVIRVVAGKPNRSSRSYEELIEKYRSKLSSGGKASGRFVPPLVSIDQKQELIKALRLHKNKLMEATKRWTEKDLENYLIPHPLLGKLTVREMLFFTVYHALHHLRLLENEYSNPKS